VSWLAVAAWGGLVGLDSSSFAQFMISRPLAAATLTGALLGRPLEGLVLGLVLEAFALLILPIGAARTPESGTAAVAAAAAYVWAAPAGLSAPLLLMAVVFGLGWERVAGATVAALRRANERLIGDPSDAGWPASAAWLERRHAAALALDLARGSAVALGGALLGTLLLRLGGPLWQAGAGWPLAALAVAGAAMLGAALPLFGGWSERRLAFLLGVLCGCALLLLG
jgi:mannose PTS system EIIC component